MSDNLDATYKVDSNSVLNNNSVIDGNSSGGIQAYDGVTETQVTGGGKRRRKRRTRGKRHTLKKARKVKSRKLRSRRARRRRGKRSRRRRHSKKHYRGGDKGCVSGTSSYAVAGNTLSPSESMLANPPSAFSH